MLALAILCPPLYFICVKKWGMFILTSIMAVIALFLVFFIAPPLIIWAIASLMAIYHWKSKRVAKMLDQHADRNGRSVAVNLAGKP